MRLLPAVLRAGPMVRWPDPADSRVQTTVFLALLTAAFALKIPALMLAYVLLAIGVIAMNLQRLAAASIRERNAMIVVVLALTPMLPLSIIKSETAIIHYVVVLTSMGVAVVFTRNLRIYHVASRLILVVSQLLVCAYLLRSGLANFPLDDILPDSSSNGVTSYLVLMQANYCAVNYLLTRRASLSTALLTLAICVVGYGRGSILAAAIIVFIGLLSRLSARSYLRALLGLPLLLLLVLFVWSEYGATIADFVLANTKIGSGLYDVHREAIINEYLQRIDATTLWTGASYQGTSIVAEYNSNPHNSYIRAHYIFGLPYLLLIFALPLYLFKPRQPWSLRAYAFGIYATVLFRALTEPVLFPTLFDFYYFAMCFVMATGPLDPRLHQHRRAGARADHHASAARA